MRCIKHTRALQRVDPQQYPHWALPSDSEGPDARISQLEGQLAQMEVGMSVCWSVLDLVLHGLGRRGRGEGGRVGGSGWKEGRGDVKNKIVIGINRWKHSLRERFQNLALRCVVLCECV